MLTYVTGSIFQSPAQTLVNTVNTVGVMGKGVALEFKKIFPEMFKQYQLLCENRDFKIGTLWLYRSPNKWVLNFPTKENWRQPSRVNYIEVGLQKFVDTYTQMNIHSIAFPALGCGHGQLDFESQVQPIMESYLRNLPIDIFVYPHRNDDIIPEHKSKKEMREWLRTEPINLPFSEVWEDLIALLNQQSNFKTIARDNEFTAYISSDKNSLDIFSSNTQYSIPYEGLLSFWQQLRTYGFSMRNIAPSLDRKMSYLIAIIQYLPYVSIVQLSDNYKHFQRTPIIGLQVLPEAFQKKSEVTQLSLF